MTNSPRSTLESLSCPHTLSHSISTVSSRESLRRTISAHFTAIDMYLLPHGACCSHALDSVIVNPRTLLRFCRIRIPLGVARRILESGQRP